MVGIDARFRTFSPAVACLLLGVAAYFQAAGAGQIIASATLSSMPPGARREAPSIGHAPLHGGKRLVDADAVLVRNPFDSVTGSLLGKETEPGPEPPGSAKATDPYDDPRCDTGQAVLIAASEDAAWSFAAVAGPEGKTALVRKGDSFGDKTVLFIGDQRGPERRANEGRDVWDRVWLASSGGKRCQLELGEKAPPAPAASGKAPARSDLATKIRRRSDREVEIDRSTLDAVLANPKEIMKARIVPDERGVRVSGIRSGSLIQALGLENGDRLVRINGFELNDHAKLLEAYSKLQRAERLSVEIERGGKATSIDVVIK